VLPRLAHRQSRYLNRAENSYQPTRQGERRMKRLKSPEYEPNGISQRTSSRAGSYGPGSSSSAQRPSASFVVQ
jgi:transposase-like protein